MQQRVGLARALAVDPEILFFDEPFSALDPLIRRDMQDEVIRLHREVGKTMVFITHDLHEALRLGDRILIMRDGADGPGRAARTRWSAPRPTTTCASSSATYPGRTCSPCAGWSARPGPASALDGPELGPDVIVRDAARVVLSARRPGPRGGATVSCSAWSTATPCCG